MNKQSTSTRPRKMKQFNLPKGCSVKTFVMRELDGNDDLEAAIMADKSGPAAAKDSITSAITVEQREKLRMSLVSVDGKPVNREMPYGALDGWSMRTIRFAERAYNELNGLTSQEMDDFLKGAVVVEDETQAAPSV